MTRRESIDRSKRLEAFKRKEASQSPEDLARELNIILRTLKYPSQEELKAGAKRCLARVGKENKEVLFGRKNE